MFLVQHFMTSFQFSNVNLQAFLFTALISTLEVKSKKIMYIYFFLDQDDYVAFGLSGSEEKSQMMNSDVAISYINGHQGYTEDYNITAFAPVRYFEITTWLHDLTIYKRIVISIVYQHPRKI